MEDSTPAPWFADEANPEIATSLGRHDFLRHLWSVIDESRVQQASTVFGLVGPWGSGKTSILEWVRTQTETDDGRPRWRHVSFNPWDYQDVASLQMGFFAELAQAFGTSKKVDQLRSRVAAFGHAVAPLASIGAIAGLDASATVEGIAKLLDGDRSVASTKRALIEKLKSTKTPLLVVIDDLDRVSSEELLLTFKLVRELGRLPYVHYLLAYDELTVLDVLSRTSLVGKKNIARARDYMEKVVQFRFDIPRVRSIDIIKLTNDALKKLQESKEFVIESNDFSNVFWSFIASRLTTPRAVGRYFAQFRPIPTSLWNELNIVDFLVLTWIRTFEPSVYQLVQERRRELVGEVGYSMYRASMDTEERARSEQWQKLLSDAGINESRLQAVGAALAFLFPKFAAFWNNHRSYAASANTQRISNDDYFDRYFTLGVTEEDIADATVRTAVSGASGDTPTPRERLAAIHVELKLEEQPALVTGKICREVEQLSEPTPALLGWLAKLYVRLPFSADVIAPARQLEAAVARLFRAMPPDQLTLSLEAVRDAGGIDLLIGGLDGAPFLRVEDSNAKMLNDDQRGIVSSAFTVHIDRIGDRFLSMTPTQRGRVFAWERIDRVAFGNWLRTQQAAIGEIETASFFVETVTATSAEGTRVLLAGLDVQHASEYLDLSVIANAFANEIADQPVLPQRNYGDGPPDTPANRREITLDALRAYLPAGADTDIVSSES